MLQAARDELSPKGSGTIAVSGMLAEQLAKELGAGAAPGAVSAYDAATVPVADVVVRIIAGDPSGEDETFVAVADRREIPVVIVQLWPQPTWTAPFVLTPFVVECRAGQGFPLREIADRIFEASEHGAGLAARIPALEEAAASAVVRHSVLRSALLGAASGKGPTRPLVTLEQVRMLARLRATRSAGSDEMPAIAGGVGLTLASGFAFRGLARAARNVLPATVANAAVAASGTWLLAKALRAVETRIPTA